MTLQGSLVDLLSGSKSLVDTKFSPMKTIRDGVTSQEQKLKSKECVQRLYQDNKRRKATK